MSQAILEFQTASDEETVELGRHLASLLPRRAVVLLIGNLGAGKTTLAKGIVSGLGAAKPEEVSSPTFTLIHEYRSDTGQITVFHVDLYRLNHGADVATLGLEEIFDREAIVLIEWGERFPDMVPENRIEIHLDSDLVDANLRRIRVIGLIESRSSYQN